MIIMPSLLVLTEESMRLLSNACGKHKKIVIVFKKQHLTNTYLNFFPEVIENLVISYLSDLYTCEVIIKPYIYVVNVLNTNIYFEIYRYNTYYDVHSWKNYKNCNSRKIVEYECDHDIYIMNSLIRYMRQYYSVNNYFRKFKYDATDYYKNKIKKIHDHKSFKLMIVMIKVMLRVIDKKLTL